MRSFLVVVGCLLLMSGGEDPTKDIFAKTFYGKELFLVDGDRSIYINPTSISFFIGTEVQYQISHQNGDLVITAPPKEVLKRWTKAN